MLTDTPSAARPPRHRDHKHVYCPAFEMLRMRRAAEAIHAAGPRAVLGLLEDLAREPDTRVVVLAACDRFARLRPDTLRRLGLAELPPLPLRVVAS